VPSQSEASAQRAGELGRHAAELRRAGKAREAVLLLREAVRLAPNHAGLVGNLGNALLASGERSAAIAALERACTLEPGASQLAYNLGTALLDEGRLADARAALERALALGKLGKHAFEAHARVNLGRLDEIEGQLESAAEQWRRAAELAPRLARPHYLLARVGRLLDRAPLEALAAATDTPAAERVEAHFGLGHALEGEGRFAEAFEHFERGNRAKRALVPRFDPAGHEREAERIVRTFDAAFFRELRPAHPSDAPIFVVGLPRSGTTLVESILAAHPEVAARGERPEIDRLARSWRARGFPETARTFPLEERHSAAGSYLRALDLPGGARRATDKLPGNYVHLGLIAMLFPGARVVHCRRDPLDTAFSLYSQLFEGDALAFSYDLEHIARVIRVHRRLAEHWRACLPLALLELDYEELVRDFEGGARELVRFAGLEWDARCLARGRGAVHTASAWRVRAPVDATSIGRWRRHSEQLAPLRTALGELASPS
jgi:tetratricopeptide (TPR) repeat protein